MKTRDELQQYNRDLREVIKILNATKAPCPVCGAKRYASRNRYYRDHEPSCNVGRIVKLEF